MHGGDGALPFPLPELLQRRDRVLALMERRGLDLLLLSNPANYFYLTGLDAQVEHYIFLLALKRDGAALWIGRRMEMSNVEALAPHTWVKQGLPIEDSEDGPAALGRAVAAFAGAGTTVGYEGIAPEMPAARFTGMAAAAAGLRFVDASGLVQSLRAIKSPAEVALMRRAGAIVSKTLREGLAALREGDSDSDLALSLMAGAIRNGSHPMPCNPYVTCGLNSYRAHSSWTHRPIARGEVINTEMAAVQSRYCAAAFRISVLGPPSDALRRFHDASQAGLQAGLERIEPGMTAHQGDAVVRDAIAKAGYGDYFPVRAGYGLGIGFPPSWAEQDVAAIRPGDQSLLKPGMCFHLVPALYKADLGAVCCSLPIHLTDRGVEPLAEIEPRLFVLPV